LKNTKSLIHYLHNVQRVRVLNERNNVKESILSRCSKQRICLKMIMKFCMG